jgi:predicted RNase H-like HicB family nuclease
MNNNKSTGLKNDRYTYRVTWSEDDKEYVGFCAEFLSLSWLSKKLEAALIGIRKLVENVVRDMQNEGEATPEPIACRHYSGKFIVRVPPPKFIGNSQYRQPSLG